jgi:hypothetical protein
LPLGNHGEEPILLRNREVIFASRLSLTFALFS